MSEDWIGREATAGVGILTIRRPATLNALSPALLSVFSRAFADFCDEAAGVRCVVITGQGRAFCAGADLSEDGGNGVPGQPQESVLRRAYHPVLRQLRDSPVPIVAAVNGPAVGAGMSLAMMADIIVCARSAYFLQAFRRIGLVPDCGSTWLLPRRIGGARASELALLGEKLSADKALEWGLVNRVVDDDALMTEALSVASRIADGPLAAQRDTRRLLWETSQNTFEQQIDLEDRLQLIATVSAEFVEGAKAFQEKRAADFRNAPPAPRQ